MNVIKIEKLGERLKRVYFPLIFVMLLWGLNVSALKVLVTNVDPIILTAVRIFVAGIVVLIIAYFMGIFRLPTRKEIAIIIYIAIFNVIAHHIFLALGLTYTSGVNTGLILGMGPLITMMLSIILLNDRVTRLRVLGFILGFIGVVVTSLTGADNLSTISFGDLFVFISIFAQAFSFILIAKLNPSFDPRLLTGYMLIFGSVIIFITSFFFDSSMMEITNLFSWKLGLVFLFSAILCTAVGHMIYNYTITEIGPAETTIFINMNTVFALAGAAVFLGEPIYINHFIGLFLIICGVLIGSGTLEYFIKKRRHTAK